MLRILILLAGLTFFVGSLVMVTVHVFTAEGERTLEYTSQDEMRASLSDPLADSDGDGLYNWEEDLYRTSKQHSDSDGDGVTDYAEVGGGTDPVVYGAASGEVAVVREDTAVYDFRQLSHPDSLEELIAGVAGSATLSNSELERETFSSDSLSLKQCFNQLGTIVQNSLVTSATDVATINLYMTGQSTNRYPVEQLRNASEAASNRLLIFSTDGCMELEAHVAQLRDSYERQTVALGQALATVASTTEHFASWSSYAQAVELWSGAMLDLRSKAISSGVEFSAAEPGYVFVRSVE